MPAARIELAFLLLTTQRYPEADELLKQVIQSSPSNFFWLLPFREDPSSRGAKRGSAAIHQKSRGVRAGLRGDSRQSGQVVRQEQSLCRGNPRARGSGQTRPRRQDSLLSTLDRIPQDRGKGKSCGARACATSQQGAAGAGNSTIFRTKAAKGRPASAARGPVTRDPRGCEGFWLDPRRATRPPSFYTSCLTSPKTCYIQYK